MTVRENLELGAYQRNDAAGIAEDLDRSYGLFPRLKERESQKAGTLSGGEQQMCAIGRALMARPRLLLLDEPSMGLAPILVDRIFEIIVEINKQGTTVLVVEQNASIALSVANRGYVLETGEIKLTDDAVGAARRTTRCASSTSARPEPRSGRGRRRLPPRRATPGATRAPRRVVGWNSSPALHEPNPRGETRTTRTAPTGRSRRRPRAGTACRRPAAAGRRR